MWGEGSATLWSLALCQPLSPHWSATGLPDGCGDGRITQNQQCKNISGPLYPHRVSTESEVKPAVKAGRDLATLVSYIMVPRPLPTPAPPLVGEPIVEGYNVKTHNFYEIKVDF